MTDSNTKYQLARASERAQQAAHRANPQGAKPSKPRRIDPNSEEGRAIAQRYTAKGLERDGGK